MSSGTLSCLDHRDILDLSEKLYARVCVLPVLIRGLDYSGIGDPTDESESYGATSIVYDIEQLTKMLVDQVYKLNGEYERVCSLLPSVK